jgi:hypothetical protein
VQRERETPKGRSYKLLEAARGRARKKDREFSLERAWIEEILTIGTCQVTGIKFDMKLAKRNDNLKNNSIYAPSVDRIENSRGYTPDNSRITLYAYNTGKNEWADTDMVRMARALMKFHESEE